jgi:GNAT superfamily N-acetyltransferase
VSTKIDWLLSDDVPELQAFIERQWRPGHVLARDERLLRWQYRHTADDDVVSVLAARDGRRLSGFLGLVQTSFNWLGERRSGAWLAMWSVEPGARRSGLGLALLAEAMRRFDVVACVGFNQTAGRIFHGFGFDVRWAISRWVRTIDAAAVERPQWSSGRPRVVEWGEEVARRWDDCWDRLAVNLVGTARDAEFVRRRYVEHPVFSYVVRLAEGASDEIGALCVHRIEQVGDSGKYVLRIVELLGDPESAKPLVEHALADCPGVALADFFCASSRFGEPLEPLGFVNAESLRDPPPHRFQPLEPAPPPGVAFWQREGGGEAFAHAPIYATLGDGDQDRPN